MAKGNNDELKVQIGGLPGIMKLAAAAGEHLGKVSDMGRDAMTAVGREESR